MKWKIDPEGFAEAKRLLGIQLPVRVRFIDATNSSDTMTGKYHGIGYWGITSAVRLDEPTHHVSLDADLTTDTANRTLWHELTHVAQAEDFLPQKGRDGLEPYQLANKGMRMAFARELRKMGKSYSYDVSFEKEAVHFMKNASAIKIVIPIPGKEEKKSSSTAVVRKEKVDHRRTFRVDMWAHKDEGGYFVDTAYVLAAVEIDAKSWARKEYMKGMRYSDEIIVTEVIEPPTDQEIQEDDYMGSFSFGNSDWERQAWDNEEYWERRGDTGYVA